MRLDLLGRGHHPVHWHTPISLSSEPVIPKHGEAFFNHTVARVNASAWIESEQPNAAAVKSNRRKCTCVSYPFAIAHKRKKLRVN